MPSALPVVPPDRRRPYALFWWWLAAGVATWYACLPWLATMFPDAGDSITCGWTTYGVELKWRVFLSSFLRDVEGCLFLVTPALLLLLTWTVAVRGGRGPRTHLRAAGAGTLAVALQYTVVQVIELLDWMPEDASCSVDPDTLNGVSLTEITWTLGPAALVIAACWAGTRPWPGAPGRRAVPRRAVAVTASVTAGVLMVAAVAVVAVRLAHPHHERPAVAADGTPRHLLARSGRRLLVLDQQTGAETGRAPTPDKRFYNYTAVVPGDRPGQYVAAASTNGDGVLGEARSRIYRITVDGDGAATLAGQVGGDLNGVVRDLAVSAEGRIAYSRTVIVMSVVNGPEVTGAFVGVTGAGGEWPMPPESFDVFGESALALQWADRSTLLYRGTVKGTYGLLALQVDAPAGSRPAGSRPAGSRPAGSRPPGRLYFADQDGFGTSDVVVSPATGRAIVLQGGLHLGMAQRLIVQDLATRTPLGQIAFPRCDMPATGLALDRTGTHLLVTRGYEFGGERELNAACLGPHQIVRVDLPPGPLPARSPASRSDVLPELATAQRVIWHGDRALSGLAW